jgi:hypothetical protein
VKIAVPLADDPHPRDGGDRLLESSKRLIGGLSKAIGSMRCTGSSARVETQFGESGLDVSRPSSTPRFSGFLAKALKTPSATTGASTQAAIEKRIMPFQERFMMTVSHLTVSLEQRGLDILAELRLTGIVPKPCLIA